MSEERVGLSCRDRGPGSHAGPQRSTAGMVEHLPGLIQSCSYKARGRGERGGGWKKGGILLKPTLLLLANQYKHVISLFSLLEAAILL